MERPADNAEGRKRTAEQRAYQGYASLTTSFRRPASCSTSLTNYASVAITPAMTQIAIRQFEIIAVDKMNFVIVVVTDSGTVKNKMVPHGG